MAVLTEGQRELDGYLFGWGCPVDVLAGGDTTDTVTVRDQDQDHPQSDQVLFGRDYLTGPTREFLLVVEAVDAVAELAKLRQAWRADGVRRTPLAVSTLRWMHHGRTFRAYGRPRDFAVFEKDPGRAGKRYVQCKFRYRDAIVYDDQAQQVTLDLISGSLSPGVILPAILPWTLGTLVGERAGIVTVGGLAEVPFTAVINGPSVGSASGLKLSGPGWLLDFGALSLAAGQTLTVDTSGVGSAQVGGRSVAGYLTRASTLTGRVKPGVTEFTFAATDTSATSTATISWRPAALII